MHADAPLPTEKIGERWFRGEGGVCTQYITKGGHAQASVTTRILNKETNMANPSPVDSFFATFTGLKTILYRKISLLTVIIFPLAYQIIIVDFLSEEHMSGACNNTGKQFQMSI